MVLKANSLVWNRNAVRMNLKLWDLQFLNFTVLGHFREFCEKLYSWSATNLSKKYYTGLFSNIVQILYPHFCVLYFEFLIQQNHVTYNIRLLEMPCISKWNWHFCIWKEQAWGRIKIQTFSSFFFFFRINWKLLCYICIVPVLFQSYMLMCPTPLWRL